MHFHFPDRRDPSSRPGSRRGAGGKKLVRRGELTIKVARRRDKTDPPWRKIRGSKMATRRKKGKRPREKRKREIKKNKIIERGTERERERGGEGKLQLTQLSRHSRYSSGHDRENYVVNSRDSIYHGGQQFSITTSITQS